MHLPIPDHREFAAGPDGRAPYSHRRHAQWQTIAVSVAVVLAVGAGILGLWITSTRSIQESYRHYLVGLAQTAANLVDPTLHDRIRRPDQLNGAEYTRAVLPLRRMRAALPDVHYIYTVVRDGDAVRFVLDAAEPGAALVTALRTSRAFGRLTRHAVQKCLPPWATRIRRACPRRAPRQCAISGVRSLPAGRRSAMQPGAKSAP